jgi:catechol 2,3-dioxygenase-like lactoylglutathione lyase family enzyme
MPAAKGITMISFTSVATESDSDSSEDLTGAVAANPSCYSVTIFTQRWKEVRDFYVDILNARVLSERTDRYCEMNLGGIPITVRRCEHGETVSYFHLYVSMKNREGVLGELRRRGIIVTSVGPYTNFRDPEGRVIKLSEEKTIVA